MRECLLYSVKVGKKWETFEVKSTGCINYEKEDAKFRRQLERRGIKVPVKGLSVIFVRVSGLPGDFETDVGLLQRDGIICWCSLEEV